MCSHEVSTAADAVRSQHMYDKEEKEQSKVSHRWNNTSAVSVKELRQTPLHHSTWDLVRPQSLCIMSALGIKSITTQCIWSDRPISVQPVRQLFPRTRRQKQITKQTFCVKWKPSHHLNPLIETTAVMIWGGRSNKTHPTSYYLNNRYPTTKWL